MNHRRITRSAALSLAIVALAAPAAGARPAQDVTQAAQPRQDLRLPDSRDAAAGRGSYNSPEILVVEAQPQPASPDGMDWADAGIGAGSLLGVSLIGLGGALAIVHRRHGAADAATTAGV